MYCIEYNHSLVDSRKLPLSKGIQLQIKDSTLPLILNYFNKNTRLTLLRRALLR